MADENHPSFDDVLDRRLDLALRSLPREAADVGFTTRVMSNLHPSSSRLHGSWRALLASAALLLLAVVAGQHWRHQHMAQQSRVRVADLRAEQQAIEVELARLQRLRDDARPVLFLGTDRDVDLVFDLSQLRRNDPRATPWPLARMLGSRTPSSYGAAQPAVFEARQTY